MEKIKFIQDQKSINKSLTKMASLVLANFTDSLESLGNLDKELAEKIIDNDEIINAMELKIDEKCTLFISRHMPLAKDLRTIQSIYKISADLERIGDIAGEISSLVILIDNKLDEKISTDIDNMTLKIKEMVNKIMDCFQEEKLDLILKIIDSDDEIDQDFYAIRGEIIEKLKNDKTVNANDYALYLFVIKYLEKIGDHVVNISKWIFYKIEGNFINARNKI